MAPIASSLIKKTQSRKILFLAVFLHDIGKGKNIDHTIVGEKIANQICQNLKLKDQETETITWLVRNHLLMSKYAFNYDVSDPKTILNFTPKNCSFFMRRNLALFPTCGQKCHPQNFPPPSE